MSQLIYVVNQTTYRNLDLPSTVADVGDMVCVATVLGHPGIWSAVLRRDFVHSARGTTVYLHFEISQETEAKLLRSERTDEYWQKGSGPQGCPYPL